MLLNSTIQSNKSEILQQKYIELINKGILPEKILVLCLNSYKKQNFIKAVENNVTIPVYGKYNIQTFYGLCYNAIIDNWPNIENTIKNGESKIIPNLCGLELSRMFLSESINNGIFKDYFSKNNLVHQMFKRMQLIVLNGLSKKQIAEKSKLLEESFYEDTTKAYDKFKKLTLKYRSFDYLRQLSILPFILENTKYFSNIEYLFVDDADEMTFSEYNFIKNISSQLKDWYIAFDKNGASRCGYLSAYKTGVYEFEKIFKEKSKIIKTNSKAEENANKVYTDILNGKKSSPNNFSISSYVKRLDMLDASFEQILNLFNQGAKPSDIAIITPTADEMLKITFERFFGQGINYQLLSGSKKPNESILLKNIFTILKLIHKNWNLKIDVSEYRSMFFDCLKIPMKYTKNAVNDCIEAENLVETIFENSIYQKKYNELKYFTENFSIKNICFSEEIILIFQFLSKDGISKSELKIFNFFLKEIRSFETAYGELQDDLKKKIIQQFQNGIISENPSTAEEIDENAVIISTPQKIIDFEIKRKYQIWLDLSNDLWAMRDLGVLYNAWVFNAEWENKKFTVDDNIQLAREKNARVMRKLFLCCQKEIYAYFSQYDSSGYENIGVLQSYFHSEIKKQNTEKRNRVTPREDQKQVIEYKGGMAAVNAVPGAGKTTVLTELIIKLIESGISLSNIYVLTYMESAAENIREKIKKTLPNLTEMPNISTIHGLSFKIIKENNNYTKLNLADNIEVADDNTRNKIINDCISSLNLNYDDFNDYQTGISAVKLSPNGIKPLKYLKNNIKFDKLYDLYEQNLRKKGLIDYDDMLRYAVELVEKFPEIKNYYANTCHFIFEDEAQDSSELQQKLLLMLSSKYGNLLRIGDINQAITSSFTDSDPKCFKKFFEENRQMIMKSSQRSSIQIQNLANNLLDFSKTKDLLKETFYDSKLIPTGKNPESNKNPEFHIFEKSSEEKFYILNQIRTELNKKNRKNIAILLRNNYQIAEWLDFLSQNGLTVTTRSDILEQKNIFKVILSFLEFLQTPFSNNCILKLMETFNSCEIISFSDKDKDFIKNLKIPFINTNGDNLSESLSNLWWDIQFNGELSCEPLDIAALKIGLRYFSTQNEKSNIYLLSTIIKRLSLLYQNRQTVLEKLVQISKRPIGSSFKFFEEEQNKDTTSVRIMTMHKSKGDEFDIVFIPELTEENYPLISDKIKNKSSLSETIKQLRYGYKKRTPLEIKKEIAEETLRLLYVGITRAKEEIYLTSAKLNRFHKIQTPSELFENLGGQIL